MFENISIFGRNISIFGRLEEIFQYLEELFQYLVCLFVQDDEGKDMVGGGPWRGALPNLRVRPSGGEKTPEKYYCP